MNINSWKIAEILPVEQHVIISKPTLVCHSSVASKEHAETWGGTERYAARLLVKPSPKQPCTLQCS